MAFRQYVVRVVLTDEQCNRDVIALLECFRYAGYIRRFCAGGAECFDMESPTPETEDGHFQWSKMQSERLRTFGFNAVHAPKQV